MLRLLPAVLLFDLSVLVGGTLPPLDPQPGAEQRVHTSQPDVVWIPGDWYLRGSDDADIRYAVQLCARQRAGLAPGRCPLELFIDERPQRLVWVSEYGLDRREVTNRQWRRCMRSGACPPSRLAAGNPRVSQPSQPVAGISWHEASAYCEFVGGRLPTEAEWERAARGHDDRRFPWGDHYNPRLANHGRAVDRSPPVAPDGVDGYRYAAPVGSFPDGASPYGLLDMAGNVWEWTADRYQPESYLDASRVDPQGAETGGERIVRGGSWRFPAYTLRVTNRARLAEREAWPDVGFRCAYDPR